METYQLNAREEEVMRIIWQLKKAFVKDIIEQMEEPHPPYNTISSIVRKLEKEGLLGHESFGNTHRYYPKLKLKTYRSWSLKHLMKHYFSDDPASLVVQFMKEENLSPEEITDLIKKYQNK